MRIHHLNCGTCCPPGGAFFDGTSRGLAAHLVCHCLLIETGSGLVLVDTGFGTRDVARRQRLSLFFRGLNRPQLRASETAHAQVKALGFRVDDVRHIIVTHLDFDHAGGLEDFPCAAIHVMAREKDVANRGEGGAFVGRRRYRPQQWNDVENWRLYPAGGGEAWRGFRAVRALEGLPPEILLVPLAGHTWGHCGIAIDRGYDWLFHAADAYFFRGELDPDYHCPPGLAAYQRLMEVDRVARLENQQRIRTFARDDDVTVFCAHDAVEFARLHGSPGTRGRAMD